MSHIPEPTVTAHLHGGPNDGDTVTMPWARLEFPPLDFEESGKYVLRDPWRGQDTAHYKFVEG